MHIYIKRTTATESQLLTLSDKLYGCVYADRGLTDFYYAFTKVGDNYDVNFEILGTDKQVAFIQLVNASFDIVRIQPAEDGEEEEKEAIEWWSKSK